MSHAKKEKPDTLNPTGFFQLMKKGLKRDEDWTKVNFLHGSDWKTEIADIIHWLRHFLGIICGIIWGVIPLEGFVGVGAYIMMFK